MGIKLVAITALSPESISLLFLRDSFVLRYYFFEIHFGFEIPLCAISFLHPLRGFVALVYFFTPETALLRYYQFLTEDTVHAHTHNHPDGTHQAPQRLSYFLSSQTPINFIFFSYPHSLNTQNPHCQTLLSLVINPAGNRPLMDGGHGLPPL